MKKALARVAEPQATHKNFFQNEYDPKADYGRCTIGRRLIQLLQRLRSLQPATSPAPASSSATASMRVPRCHHRRMAGCGYHGLIHSGFGITPFAGSYMGDQNPLSASSLTGSYQPRPDCVVCISWQTQSLQTVQIGGSIGKDQPQSSSPSEVPTTQNGGNFGNCQSDRLAARPLPALPTLRNLIEALRGPRARQSWRSLPSSST